MFLTQFSYMKTTVVGTSDGLWPALLALLEEVLWPIDRAAPTPVPVNVQPRELAVYNLTVSETKQ